MIDAKSGRIYKTSISSHCCVQDNRTERLRGRKAVAQRKRRLKRTNGLCERCLPDKVRAAVVIDHIVPLAHGGSDEDENTRNLCKPCHDEVTAEQFGHRRKQAIGTDGWPQ